MKGNEIRSKFLDFFSERGHAIKSSASLVPDDPTVLFSIAGMVQFKKMFLGQVPLEFTRAASSQKCLRTNDIDNVGRTARHHTFFEMLGNFSFGDYFKREAITWAWEFLVAVLGLPVERLWVSIYREDDEAFDIWYREVGLPEERIVRMGMETNFWTMGPTGPCGPCSEIIIDQGEEVGCGQPGCKVGCDCDRYLELWNLVFTQFDRQEDGRLLSLPKKNIDTGMGLERLASILQGVPNNFETDLLKPIIDATQDLSEVIYGRGKDTDISFKVIADHMRAITFLISDGVLPSNEGRGYVLRRLLRRAIRHSKILGFEGPFLYRLVGVVVEIMKEPYPELMGRREHISKIVKVEEDGFQRTLDQGVRIIEDLIAELKRQGKDRIPGEDAFRLYDTYGFPLDLTQEIAREEGLVVDEGGFETAMARQRERARMAWQGAGAEVERDQYAHLAEEVKGTEFLGYELSQVEAKVLTILKEKVPVEIAREGEEIEVLLDRTPFYGEAGGQKGDKGVISSKKAILQVVDTQRPLPQLIVHLCKVTKGTLAKGDPVVATIDLKERRAIARNHTATHLLQAALRYLLGSHIEQCGSLVDSDRLRFDFTHFEPLTERMLAKVEEIMNDKVRENLPVENFETTLEEAKRKGALAFFGEKYGERVRVVRIADWSLELCGGTHVKATGEIGLCKIIGESGVAAGIRRIEVLTGEGAYNFVRREEEALGEIGALLKASPQEAIEKVKKLIQLNKDLEREAAYLKVKLASLKVDDLLQKTITVKGIKLIVARMDGLDLEGLRSLVDMLKERLASGIIVLGALTNGKVNLVAGVTKDLTPRVHAGRIINAVAKIVGGGGGGRPDMAQAGGKDSSKLDEALAKVGEIVEGGVK